MTIAMCYLSPEGVVFGADSTASRTGGIFHFFNHNQKIFQIGEDTSFGIMTWGHGGLGATSFRTLFADLGAELKKSPPTSKSALAGRWIDLFWDAYSKALSSFIGRSAALRAKKPHIQGHPPDPAARSQAEEEELAKLADAFVVGFCLGGHLDDDRTPFAFEILFDLHNGKPQPVEIGLGTNRYWGAPNIVDRLIHGYDLNVRNSVFNSPQWNGTEQELDAVLQQHKLEHPIIPIRDAVDFVYSCIFSTIKGLKFSGFPQICGGPIELAVITTDRQFRWVRHKPWDAALLEGDIE